MRKHLSSRSFSPFGNSDARLSLCQISPPIDAGPCGLRQSSGTRDGLCTERHELSLRGFYAVRGLNFVHSDGVAKKEYLVGIMSAGLATFDIDNDGLTDVYLLGGSERALAATGQPSSTTPSSASSGNGLFRNLGQGKFASVSRNARAELDKLCLGVAVADFDNDGFKDIAVSGLKTVAILHNQGDGTFVEVSSSCGLAEHGIAFGAGVAFLDANRDGNVDLYVADYVNFSATGFEQLAAKSFPYPPGPEQYDHRPTICI